MKHLQKIWRFCIAHLCAIMLSLFIIQLSLSFTGCKTVQTQERIVYRDSTTVRVVHDTIREIVHDTTHIAVQHSTRTDEGTVIEFANGGGSYNSKTGEANNVQRVQEQKQTEQNTNLQIEWQHTAEIYKIFSDSLQDSLIDLQQEYETLKQATTPTKWHRFLVWWFWITMLVIVSSVIWWVIKVFYLR